MNLKIQLQAHSNAEYKITVNGFEVDTLDPNQPNIICIEHFNKRESHTAIQNGKIISDRALELKSIQFDDYKIPEVVLYNISFKVHPFMDVIRDLPDTINSLYFGYNGVYEIKFDNFYKWYFTQLEIAERIAHNHDDSLVKYGNIVEVNDATDMTIYQLQEIIDDPSI